MSTVNIISFIIFVLSLKQLVNLSVKIQALEKLNKTDHRAIQIQTEKFKGEPILALHYKNREEQPKVFTQPTLIYPVTIQKFPNDRIGAELTPVPM